jgi:hypothetical protein
VPADLIGSGRFEELEQTPRALAEGGHVRRVLRIQVETPCRDDHGDGRSSGHQVSEDPGLDVLERGHRLIAVHHRPGHVQGVGPPIQDVRDCHGQIADQGGVGHVAEVGDPRDAPTFIDQHVVEAHVVVEDLGSEPRQHGKDTRLESVEGPLDHRPLLGVQDVGHHRAQSRCTADIPQDRVPSRRVDEPAEGPPEPGHRNSPGAQGFLVQLLGGRIVAVQEGEEPDQRRAPVVTRDARPVVAIHRRDQAHHGEVGVLPLDVQDRLRLELDHRDVVGRILDLQEERGTPVLVEPEVQVALAGQGSEGTGAAEDPLGDPLHLPERERGRRGLQRIQDLGVHGRQPIPSSGRIALPTLGDQGRSNRSNGSCAPDTSPASSALVAQDGNGNRTWMGMGMWGC